MAFCECPRCKLGEEQVGFGDELHMKQQLEDPDLLKTIDDELMRLDPSYALRRVDGEASVPFLYPFLCITFVVYMRKRERESIQHLVCIHVYMCIYMFYMNMPPKP